jgi:hypothetical protein
MGFAGNPWITCESIVTFDTPLLLNETRVTTTRSQKKTRTKAGPSMNARFSYAWHGVMWIEKLRGTL